MTRSVLKQMKFILLLTVLLSATLLRAQTYTTVVAGNWSSASTWSGGVAPGNSIAAGATVNITKKVVYDLSKDLTVLGNLIVTGDTLKFSSNQNLTINGMVKVTNGGIIGDITQKAIMTINGYVSFTNAKVIYGQGITGTSGSSAYYSNSYILTGGNYAFQGKKNSLIADTIKSSIIKAWPSDGSNADITLDFGTFNIANAQFYASHDFHFMANGTLMAYGTPTFGIDTLNVGNNLVNDATGWQSTATINAYCVGDTVQGPKAALIKFTKPSICSNPSQIVFSNPTLIAGNDKQDGATYKFSGVSYGLDATVQIMKRSSPSVKVYSIDVTNTGYDKAFQPQVGIPGGIPSNSMAWMEFDVKFYRAGTTQLAKLQKFYVTALDVDGDGSSVSEFVQFEKADSVQYGSGSYLKTSATPLLTNVTGLVNDLVDGISNLTGTDILSVTSVDNAPGIDTTATANMATYTYITKNDFKFIVGAKNGNPSFLNVGPALIADPAAPGAPVVDPNSTSNYSNDAGLRLNSVWFKAFNLQPTSSVLPVTLTNFSVFYTKPDATISWNVAKQENFSHFVLQRSTDGKSYSDIATIFAKEAGQSSDYEYRDKNITSASGVLFYRLRMVDNTGEQSYSGVRTLRLTSNNEQSLVLATYPNPVVSQLNVTIPAQWQGKAVKLELYSVSGVQLQVIELSNASQTEIMQVGNLSKGVYLVKATCENQTAQQRIVKN